MTVKEKYRSYLKRYTIAVEMDDSGEDCPKEMTYEEFKDDLYAEVEE